MTESLLWNVGVLSYGFSKLRKTESPVFSASQVERYDGSMCHSQLRYHGSHTRSQRCNHCTEQTLQLREDNYVVAIKRTRK